MALNYTEIIGKIKSMHDPEAVKGMARYGINPENNYGVSVSQLRKMAKEIGKDHDLATRLWDSGIHDARMLACLVEIPGKVTKGQMNSWVSDFDSWDICDLCCGDVFVYTSYAYEKALEWSRRSREFEKRAGFALMARLAVRDRKMTDRQFETFLEAIKRECTDERNMVRKAVNWALRQIGKRNYRLYRKAVAAAKQIKKKDSKAARWIAGDALREFDRKDIQKRVRSRK
jgi:3-methyladenine DNA glycosylase AlkD